MIAKNRPRGCATGFDASLSRRNCRPGKQNGSGRFPGPYKIRFTLIAIERYSTNVTFAAQVSERQAGESNWLEREATRSSATRATIESRTRIAAAKQKSLPQATSASMGSGGADCLEAQAHWPCGHARGLNGKMLSPRTKQEPLSQPRSASGKLASRIGSKEKRRVAALRERRLRTKSAARLSRSING